MVGYQCGQVFRACCVKGQETAELVPGNVGDLKQTGKLPPLRSQALCWGSPHG